MKGIAMGLAFVVVSLPRYARRDNDRRVTPMTAAWYQRAGISPSIFISRAGRGDAATT
jgi:hypothetical protein